MSDKPTVEVLEDDAQGPDHSEPQYTASDPVQVTIKARKAGRIAQDRRDYMARVMAEKEGRAWIHELLAASHVFRTSYVIGDPYGTSFAEGERNIGLRILAAVMKAAPEQYATMIEEAKK